MRRIFDILASALGLITLSPLLLILMFFVWFQDKKSPFYIAPRVGRKGNTFKMVKLRTMVVNADKSGVDSTAANDMRITPVGAFARKFKLDEFFQLWNVLKGEMSLVGPRPNVQRDVALYSEEEKQLLIARPGITDIASIVFADEGELLEKFDNADRAYNQIIRPWKSRLALLYVRNGNLILNIKLILLTLLGIVSRSAALSQLSRIVKGLGADDELCQIASRNKRPYAHPPPGMDKIEDRR